MSSFETTMMQNFLAFNAVVAVTNLIALGKLARSMKAGILNSALGFLASIILSTIIAAIMVTVFATFNLPNFWNSAISQPLGMLAWSFETGPEFGLLGQIIGVIGFIILRVRLPQKRQMSAQR